LVNPPAARWCDCGWAFGPRWREQAHLLREQRLRAWLALACPLLAWLSQVVVALFVRRRPAEFYLLAAVSQGLLLLAGLFFGIRALVTRGPGGASVVVPAVIGLLISAGTLLLIGALIVAAVAVFVEAAL
jgi:hypothetical protein